MLLGFSSLDLRRNLWCVVNVGVYGRQNGHRESICSYLFSFANFEDVFHSESCKDKAGFSGGASSPGSYSVGSLLLIYTHETSYVPITVRKFQTSSAGYSRNLSPKLFGNRICLLLLWRMSFICVDLRISWLFLGQLATCLSFTGILSVWYYRFGQPGEEIFTSNHTMLTGTVLLVLSVSSQTELQRIFPSIQVADLLA